MSSISSSNVSSSALESLQEYYIDYLESQGIDTDDIDLFTNEGELDLSLYRNEDLNPYFQVIFMQFVEMVYQIPINSGSGDIENIFEYIEDGDFNKVASTLFEEDPEFYNFVIATINSDPQLMAYFAAQAGGDSEGQYVINQIANLDTSTSSDDDDDDDAEYEAKTTEYATYLLETYNLGGLLQTSINAEDAFNASLQGLFDQLNELSLAKMDLAGLLAGDEITEIEYETMADDILMYEQALFAQISYITETNATMMELFTNLEKRYYETQADAVRNFK